MLQTLAIRFATVDNAEAFKAAFLEARQYVLESQVGLAHKSRPSSHDLTIYVHRRGGFKKRSEEKLTGKRLQRLKRAPRMKRRRRRWQRSNWAGMGRRFWRTRL